MSQRVWLPAPHLLDHACALLQERTGGGTYTPVQWQERSISHQLGHQSHPNRVWAGGARRPPRHRGGGAASHVAARQPESAGRVWATQTSAQSSPRPRETPPLQWPVGPHRRWVRLLGGLTLSLCHIVPGSTRSAVIWRHLYVRDTQRLSVFLQEIQMLLVPLVHDVLMSRQKDAWSCD